MEVHLTAHQFGIRLNEELCWLKETHPDKLCLIHLAERFFTFLDKNEVIQGEPPLERGGANESKRETGAAMQ